MPETSPVPEHRFLPSVRRLTVSAGHRRFPSRRTLCPRRLCAFPSKGRFDRAGVLVTTVQRLRVMDVRRALPGP